MPQSSPFTAGTAGRDDVSIAETLPAYDDHTQPPKYASRAPSIVEPPRETRWTGGPRRQRFRNNPHPEELYAMMTIPERTPNRNPEPSSVAEPPHVSKRAVLELQVRVCSWLAALAGFSSTIYVSVHVEGFRAAAAFCQLAALLPICYDSWKILVLATEKRLKRSSTGKGWYFNLICASGAGVGCWYLWTRGQREGVFEPFGQVGAVTMAIAFMATNGVFRVFYFLLAFARHFCGCCLERDHPANRFQTIS